MKKHKNSNGVVSSDFSYCNTLSDETNTKLSSGCNDKNSGNNAWTSVAQNYNIVESCKENKKDEGNNQWCSTSK